MCLGGKALLLKDMLNYLLRGLVRGEAVRALATLGILSVRKGNG